MGFRRSDACGCYSEVSEIDVKKLVLKHMGRPLSRLVDHRKAIFQDEYQSLNLELLISNFGNSNFLEFIVKFFRLSGTL